MQTIIFYILVLCTLVLGCGADESFRNKTDEAMYITNAHHITSGYVPSGGVVVTNGNLSTITYIEITIRLKTLFQKHALPETNAAATNSVLIEHDLAALFDEYHTSEKEYNTFGITYQRSINAYLAAHPEIAQQMDI